MFSSLLIPRIKYNCFFVYCPFKLIGNLIDHISRFFVGLLEFSIYRVMSFMKSLIYVPFWYLCFFPPSHITALIRTSRTMLNRNGESEIFKFRDQMASISPLHMTFFCMLFMKSIYFTSVPHCQEFLSKLHSGYCQMLSLHFLTWLIFF